MPSEPGLVRKRGLRAVLEHGQTGASEERVSRAFLSDRVHQTWISPSVLGTLCSRTQPLARPFACPRTVCGGRVGPGAGPGCCRGLAAEAGRPARDSRSAAVAVTRDHDSDRLPSASWSLQPVWRAGVGRGRGAPPPPPPKAPGRGRASPARPGCWLRPSHLRLHTPFSACPISLCFPSVRIHVIHGTAFRAVIGDNVLSQHP